MKIRGERPTPKQIAQHEILRNSGAVVIVADEYFRFIAHFEAIRAAVEAGTGEPKLYD